MNRQDMVKSLTAQRQQIDIALEALINMGRWESGAQQALATARARKPNIATVSHHRRGQSGGKATSRRRMAAKTPEGGEPKAA